MLSLVSVCLLLHLVVTSILFQSLYSVRRQLSMLVCRDCILSSLASCLVLTTFTSIVTYLLFRVFISSQILSLPWQCHQLMSSPSPYTGNEMLTFLVSFLLCFMSYSFKLKRKPGYETWLWRHWDCTAGEKESRLSRRPSYARDERLNSSQEELLHEKRKQTHSLMTRREKWLRDKKSHWKSKMCVCLMSVFHVCEQKRWTT